MVPKNNNNRIVGDDVLHVVALVSELKTKINEKITNSLFIVFFFFFSVRKEVGFNLGIPVAFIQLKIWLRPATVGNVSRSPCLCAYVYFLKQYHNTDPPTRLHNQLL